MSAMSARHLELQEQAVAARPAYVTVDDEELVLCLTCGTMHPLESWCPRCDGRAEGWDELERRVG